MITNYTELQAALRNWLNKGTTLDARLPEFIQLAEARLRRVLNDSDQSQAATVTLTNGAGTLPADFGALQSIGNSTWGRLAQVSPSQFSVYLPQAGNPRVFQITGSTITTAPAGSGTISITYKQGIPPLASNTTNWLLTRAPDLYLFSSLLQAELYGWNDERLPMIKAAADEMIAELRSDSDARRFGAAPLAARLGRT